MRNACDFFFASWRRVKASGGWTTCRVLRRDRFRRDEGWSGAADARNEDPWIPQRRLNSGSSPLPGAAQAAALFSVQRAAYPMLSSVRYGCVPAPTQRSFSSKGSCGQPDRNNAAPTRDSV